MDEFKWTTELTQNFLHIRLQNKWLFTKKKQAWKDLYTIIIENHDFPPNITVNHLRRKWIYTIEEYNKAVAQNNTSWLYFDIIHSYLGKANGMEAFPNWTEEWINKLIDIRGENEKLFKSTTNESQAWKIVECRLREMGLPVECSVQKLDSMWFTLLKTFKSKRKFYKDDKLITFKWPFYNKMVNYCDNIAFTAFHMEKANITNESSDNESDNECLNNLKKSMKSSQQNIYQSIQGEDRLTNEEFRWTPQWTESFIHIRLQNEMLFKQNKRPWKSLHAIMMDNGFPVGLTVSQIRKKWNFTYDEYRKAVALNKTNWIYYPLMHSYLSEIESTDIFKNWSDKWILNLIDVMMENNDIFLSEKLNEDECWAIVESQIRRNGLPYECSVRNINMLWTNLKKTFKENYKYTLNKNLESSWPFYKAMKQFHDKFGEDFLPSLKPQRKLKEAIEFEDNIFGRDDFEEPEGVSDTNNEILAITCRACLGTSELMFPLFVEEDDVSLSDKIMACTSLQVAELDNLPKCVCQKCANELNAAYKFKKKCEETDQILRTRWHQHDVIKNESDIADKNMTELNDYKNSDLDNCSTNGFSDDELLQSVLMKKENTQDNKLSFKKSAKKKEVKKHSENNKRSFKSENKVIYSVVTKTGETVYKRKYIYRKVCEICGKSTQKMKEHLLSHSGIKAFKCHLCPKTFTYATNLQTHLKTHDPTPLKVCQVCGREFKRNLVYKRHLILHANERQFSCETCGKSFNTKDILRIHIRSHTGERPYSCKICGKSFYSAACVSRHQKVHRKIQIQ